VGQKFDTNLKGAFFCSPAVAKKMLTLKNGKIINITSQMTFMGLLALLIVRVRVVYR